MQVGHSYYVNTLCKLLHNKYDNNQIQFALVDFT
jgi:hypothetical protein